MTKKGKVYLGKIVALACSVAGMFSTITGQHHESSIAWNGAAIALWAVSFGA